MYMIFSITKTVQRSPACSVRTIADDSEWRIELSPSVNIQPDAIISDALRQISICHSKKFENRGCAFKKFGIVEVEGYRFCWELEQKNGSDGAETLTLLFPYDT